MEAMIAVIAAQAGARWDKVAADNDADVINPYAHICKQSREQYIQLMKLERLWMCGVIMNGTFIDSVPSDCSFRPENEALAKIHPLLVYRRELFDSLPDDTLITFVECKM